MAQFITPQPVVEVIDDLEVTTVQFPAFYALGLMPRLSKLGPAFGMPADGQEAGPMDAASFQAFTMDLLRQTSVTLDDGKTNRRVELTTSDKFNQVFAGRFNTVFKVIAFVIRVNFEAFADGSSSETAAR